VGIFENLDTRVERFCLETCWIGAPLFSQSEHNTGGPRIETQHLTALWGTAQQHHSFSVAKFLTQGVKRPEWISNKLYGRNLLSQRKLREQTFRSFDFRSKQLQQP